MKTKVHKKERSPEVTAIGRKSGKQEEGLHLLRKKRGSIGGKKKQTHNKPKAYEMSPHHMTFESLKTSVRGYNFYKHVLFVSLIPLEL